MAVIDDITQYIFVFLLSLFKKNKDLIQSNIMSLFVFIITDKFCYSTQLYVIFKGRNSIIRPRVAKKRGFFSGLSTQMSKWGEGGLVLRNVFLSMPCL